MPASTAKKITRNIWELRVKYKGNHYRVFYFFAGNKIILVHAFKKRVTECLTIIKKSPKREERIEKPGWLNRKFKAAKVE